MLYQNGEEEEFSPDNFDENDLINRHSDNKRLNLLLKKKKNDICENFTFIFFLFLLESIISSVCFYLFYLFEFCKLYSEIYYSFYYLLMAFYFFIPLFILSDSFKNHTRFRNYFLFILINIHKIVFGLLIYISLVFNSNKTLNFSDFEAKVYWKCAMCLFYLLLMVYSYFKNEKYSLKLYIYIIFGIICLSILIILLFFFAQTKNEKYEILGLYVLMSSLEIIFLINAFYSEKFNPFLNKKHLLNLKLIWKINRLEIYRYHFELMIVSFVIIKKCLQQCYNKYRCCRLIKRNFS